MFSTILNNIPPDQIALLISLLLITGIFAGTIAGLFGIGGGVVIVPALYYIFTLAEIDDTAPTIAKLVLVSDRDRHVIAFGCNPLGSATQDPLLIRFSDQEDAADWTPTTTNTAGDLLVGSGSRIVTATETRQQILVFTDISLHAMQYLGPPFTFGINMVSENSSARTSRYQCCG